MYKTPDPRSLHAYKAMQAFFWVSELVTTWTNCSRSVLLKTTAVNWKASDFVAFTFNYTNKSECSQNTFKVLHEHSECINVYVTICRPFSSACVPNELITSSVFVTTRRSPSCEFRTMTSCELKGKMHWKTSTCNEKQKKTTCKQFVTDYKNCF